jgi:uncharacterized membrane protein
MRWMIAIAALALCACQKTDDGEASAHQLAATPAQAPAPPPEFAGAIDGRGGEPFWLLKIRDDKLTLTRPAHTDLMIANAGPIVSGGAAVWGGTDPDSMLRVSLRSIPCSDGMRDETYPLTAELRAGTEILKGCAAKIERPPPEPGGR